MLDANRRSISDAGAPYSCIHSECVEGPAQGNKHRYLIVGADPRGTPAGELNTPLGFPLTFGQVAGGNCLDLLLSLLVQISRDSVQLETAVSTITQEYLLEFTSEYGISEDLHLELPNRGDIIVDFPEGKISMYTKFFEFANFRIPISQFPFDILGHYQIHFSGWMSFSKRPGKNTPQCYTKPLDSLKNWNNRFFWVNERVFPTAVAWRTSDPKDSMPLKGTRRYFLGDDVYPIFLHDDGREMDLFNLISAPNPAVIKTGTRPRTPHEVPLLTVIVSRQIDMEEPAVTSESSGAPSTIDRPPLDFSNKNPSE
ncbi:hypothetical protein Tco_1318161 [Tanacetum coccineum]